MAHFFRDYYNNISRQTFDTALIMNSKHKIVGKIIARYTNTNDNENHIQTEIETAIVFHGSKDQSRHLNFSTTETDTVAYGGSPTTLFNLLHNKQFKVYSHNKQVIDHNTKHKIDSNNFVKTIKCNSLSQLTEITHFKDGNTTFKIHWI